MLLAVEEEGVYMGPLGEASDQNRLRAGRMSRKKWADWKG